MMPIRLMLRRRNWPAWLVLCLALLLTGLAGHGLNQQRQAGLAQQFELHAQEVVDAIRERMRQHEQILLGGAGLFDAQDDVRRMAWRKYVERLNLSANYPGIQGVGFSQFMTPQQLPGHIAAVRSEGFSDYTVRPPGERERYTAIVYLEPFAERNLAAFGFDMMSEPTRALAMRRAAETGKTAISGKVRLVQENQGKAQAGFLMYVPVYRAQQVLETPAHRWAALRGFVYSPYRMNDLMRGVLRERQLVVDFVIHDGMVAADDAVMYRSQDDHPRPAGAGDPMFRAERNIDMYGQMWTVAIESRPELEAMGSDPRLYAILLLLGGGVGVTLFLMVSILIARRDHAEKLANEMVVEIRRNEEELRQNEARLNEAQRTAQLGSWELDLVSGKLYWTDEIFNLFEIDKEKFPASYEGFLNAIHPEDRDAVHQAYSNSLANRQPYEIKHRLRMADGRIKWVNERCSTEFDASGKPLRSRGTVQDITQLTEVERAARDSSQFTQSILDNAVDGIITIDERGMVGTFNRAAERIFGYKAAEVMGRNIKMLMPEPYQSQHDDYLRNYRKTGVARVIGVGREVEGLRRDGSTFPMDLAVSRSAHEGRPLFIGIVRDITERKRIEKMKAEFISTVSHELRTPLTSIRGALGLLSGGAVGELPTQVNAMLKIASNNTERLLLLINDILDMQKIESGQMVFRFQKLELTPFLRQVLQDMVGYGDQHRVKFVLTRDVPDIHLYADKDRFTQVMANLLSNAAKFSPPNDQVEVAVARQQDRLRISVTDHGLGIPPEFQPRLFERFTQADSSDTRQKGGTGLGLAITKAIVEKHGGRIGFITHPGVGTTFYVDMPLLMGDTPEPRFVPPLAAQNYSRILVVEDDADVAALIQRMLAEAGFDADIAGDAAQARAMLAANRKAYALMTLDIMLPGEDGISLFRSLREEAQTQDLPVVVLSVKADEARQILNGGAVGVLDWLAKPIDPQRLVSVVRGAAKPGQLPRVLHVEDDADIIQVVAAMLKESCTLEAATTVAAARNALLQQEFDMVLLDIGLPDGSGLDLLDTIEHRMHPPKVVVFSAQDVPPSMAARVGAVLVKSRTSNEELLRVLQASMRPGSGAPAPVANPDTPLSS
jgi:PAS domain S-box-containing protein